MISVWVGFAWIVIGILFIICGFENELDKKMTNDTEYVFSVKTLTFGKGFVDDKGKEIPVITYISADKIEEKK